MSEERFKNYYKNAKHGNEIIKILCIKLKLHKKTLTTAQIIFNYIFSKLQCTYQEQVFISLLLSAKIEENHVNFSELLMLTNEYSDPYKPIIKEKTTSLESLTMKILHFELDFESCYGFLLKVCNTLKLKDIKQLWQMLDHIHECELVNDIAYIDGKYDPKLVVLSMFNEKSLRKIEHELFVRFDRFLLDETYFHFFSRI
ncbi:hypothetical protein EDEG_03728 [Edhazardia aedis USNM 41457]|uniref:Cyclin N-terminal domain-containing protein n=1 Tax=Edhazardia aedis (strain USNM 41457) TaxID=1003232 RepID=J9DK57_EDHAE|nr:hypothetical protein EDEG_03728 [Edhazardia aedis USNM 41457]|eukprot:EJW01747.1 hypothetical protein EDEG_03728 [Edhazardia aedis USNM 41457]